MSDTKLKAKKENEIKMENINNNKKEDEMDKTGDKNEIIIEDSHKFNQEIINNNKFDSPKKNKINPNNSEKIKPN